MKLLDDGEKLPVPTYNEQTGEAVDAAEYGRAIPKIKYHVVEGDFDFVQNPDLLVYFDVPDDVRLNNRILRDQISRNGGDVAKITDSFNLRQKLQHIPYTLPTREKAGMKVTAITTTHGKDELAEADVIVDGFDQISLKTLIV